MQPKEFGIFGRKGMPVASPEMAAARWPVHCNNGERESFFNQKILPVLARRDRQSPETAAAKTQCQQTANLCIAICCDAVVITHYLADATATR